jgi:hypothetical protein
MVCRDLSHSDCVAWEGSGPRGKLGLERASVSAVVPSSGRERDDCCLGTCLAAAQRPRFRPFIRHTQPGGIANHSQIGLYLAQAIEFWHIFCRRRVDFSPGSASRSRAACSLHQSKDLASGWAVSSLTWARREPSVPGLFRCCYNAAVAVPSISVICTASAASDTPQGSWRRAPWG